MKNILSFKSALVAHMGVFSLSALALSSCVEMDGGNWGGPGGFRPHGGFHPGHGGFHRGHHR